MTREHQRSCEHPHRDGQHEQPAPKTTPWPQGRAPVYGGRVGLDDTHPRVRAVMIERIRAMTHAERFAMAAEMTDFVCDQSMAAIAATMPGATKEEVGLRWCEVHYGKELTDRVRAFLAARNA